MMTRRSRKALDGLADDLRDHLARQIEENIARGMSPEEARRQAYLLLGNPTLIQEDTRAVWAWRWLDDLRRDLAYAWRSLCRTPAFAAAAVLTLGLGIGAVTSVTTVVYGVLFRPLPFANADRLVRVVQIMRLNGAEDRVGLRPEQVASWSMHSRFLSAVGYHRPDASTLTGVPTPVRLAGAAITPALFRATADAPLEGRLLDDEDALPGNTHVVVLAYRTWTNFFSKDSGIVGRSISLDYQPYRVVGVMPQDFDFPSLALAGTTDSSGAPADSPEFWVPLQKITKTATADNDGFTIFGETFAVLRPGVTIEQATAEANTLLPLQPSRRLPIELTNPRVEQAREARPLLLLFEGAVLMVLLIACANVTNLLLARAAYRQRELAIRLSLGAGRSRLARQAAAEGLLLGAAGAVVGIAATVGGIAWFRTLPPYLLPRMHEIHVDGATLAFALIVALVAGVAVSLAAVAWTSRRGASLSLRNSTASVSTTMNRAPLRALVVIEVAAGVVLFAGAALLLSSLVHLTSINPGFDARHVFSFQVTLPPGKYDGPRSGVFVRQVSTKVSALPEVTRVTATQYRLESGDGITIGSTIDGKRASGAIRFRTVPAAFFETLGIPIRMGRAFTGADESASPQVAIVNETFARRYWPGANPLGHHVSFKLWKHLEVVGVVADARPGRPDAREYAELDVPADPASTWVAPTIFLRTAGDAPALAHEVRSIVSRLDPALVVYREGILETAIERTYADASAYTVSSTTFALLALALAAIGLHGVLAFTVGARTREIGVRVAIGANRRRLVWMVLHDALGTVAAGVIAGLFASWYLSRLLQDWLYGVTPHDPGILAGVALVFLTVGALAAYVPARRATHVDPVVALRTE